MMDSLGMSSLSPRESQARRARSGAIDVDLQSHARAQRGRPSGGVEQAVATSSASSLPESLRVAPGRGSSLRIMMSIGPVIAVDGQATFIAPRSGDSARTVGAGRGCGDGASAVGHVNSLWMMQV
jgi:hypothetical protein